MPTNTDFLAALNQWVSGASETLRNNPAAPVSRDEFARLVAQVRELELAVAALERKLEDKPE